MATWRCPHCRTVQAETARCFVCDRSATSCATCTRFRPSVINGVGYCALDRRREPLSGAEQRPCWTPPADVPASGIFAPTTAPRSVGRGLVEAVRPPISGR